MIEVCTADKYGSIDRYKELQKLHKHNFQVIHIIEHVPNYYITLWQSGHILSC